MMQDQRVGQLENAVIRQPHPMREIAILFADEIPLVE